MHHQCHSLEGGLAPFAFTEIFDHCFLKQHVEGLDAIIVLDCCQATDTLSDEVSCTVSEVDSLAAIFRVGADVVLGLWVEVACVVWQHFKEVLLYARGAQQEVLLVNRL